MSWKANWLLVLLGALTLFIGVGLVLLLVAWLRIKATEYVITSRRVFIKYGLIARRVFEVKNQWIASVMVMQGFIQRLLNYGDVIISTPGQYIGTVALYGVSDPMRIKAVLDEAIRKYRERERLEQELRQIEMEYTLGRIPPQRYEEIRKTYEEKMRKL